MVGPHIGMGQDVITQQLGFPQAPAMADHQPAMRAQYRQMIGDGFGVRGADPDIDQRNSFMPV